MRSLKFFLPILLLISLQLANGFYFEGYYEEKLDAQGDVVYLLVDEFVFYKGRQIDDIDILSIEAIHGSGNITFTLEVKGKIRSEEEYSYLIYGDTKATPYPDSFDYHLIFSNGTTRLMFSEDGTELYLNETTSWSGSLLVISVPVSLFQDADLFTIEADAQLSDIRSGRLYMDSTLPLEVFAEDEPSIFWGLLILGTLAAGTIAFFYVLFGRKARSFIISHLRKKCPNCGVFFRRGTRTCVYCGEEL